jgi:hypothetical protein
VVSPPAARSHLQPPEEPCQAQLQKPPSALPGQDIRANPPRSLGQTPGIRRFEAVPGRSWAVLGVDTLVPRPSQTHIPCCKGRKRPLRCVN